MQPELVYLSIDSLEAGQYQPRQDFNTAALQELAQSITAQGLIEPLIVRKIAQERYELIAGERRWRAARLAGLEQIPCLVGEYSDQQACTLSLIENIQRQDLNLIEEATGYRRLINEFNYHQDELAVLVGKSRSHIANIIRLLGLTPRVKQAISEQLISLGHARLLVGLQPTQQEWFAECIMKEQWSVRQLEQEMRQFKRTAMSPSNPKKDRDIQRLETCLAEQVGAPVHIIDEGAQGGGWLQVKFFDNDTLAGILDRLGLRYD
jgi:ParB family chromosome partitioning protein